MYLPPFNPEGFWTMRVPLQALPSAHSDSTPFESSAWTQSCLSFTLTSLGRAAGCSRLRLPAALTFSFCSDLRLSSEATRYCKQAS